MRFLNFVLKAGEAARLGMHLGDGIVDVAAAMRKLPLPFDPRRGKIDMISLIKMWAKAPVDALQPMREIGKQPAALFKDVTYARSDLHRILPPLSPSKNVFCVGQNYKKHIEEMSRARGVEVKFPKKPTFFTKPPTSVIGDGDVISFDRSVTQRVDYEVELAIVIGRTTKNVSTAEAMDSVFGYTIINDVSARDLQEAHGQFFKGKALDTFCPMGPCIVTADEFGSPDQGRRLTTTVNGAVRQDSTTSDLLFSCAEIVASLSQGMTLEAGDVIATGTPSGVAQGMTPPAWLRHGAAPRCLLCAGACSHCTRRCRGSFS
jgi:2-keto-4-pentenoate hydratase/2-oxohepta-3-ene-1,7-dioic acid hydratase in catechol pathway